MWKKIIAPVLVIVMMFAFLTGCSSDNGEVNIAVENAEYYQTFKDKGISINVYSWGEYIPDGEGDSLDLNKEFTKLTGIKVNYSTYATNEELYAKLKAGAASYDIIIPSDYMISRMIEEDMLDKVNFANIPNYKYITEKFKKSDYDPTSEYSIPYTWGTVVIFYDKNNVDLSEEEIDWNVLWDEKYKDQILMFDNPRDAFAISEIILGYSLNTESEEELKAAAEKLKEQKPLVQAYVMDEIFDKMSAGEALFAPYYAGDGVTLMKDYDHLGFVVPKSGTNLFVDAMCIPKNAEQKEAAEMYINFMCEPQAAKSVAEYIGYSSPNDGALNLLDKEITENLVSYPAQEYLNSYTEVFKNLSPEANKLMQDLWTEIKSAK